MMKSFSKLAKAYRIDNGKRFRLKDFDPADTGKLRSREQAAAMLEQSIVQLTDLQDKLYAQERWAVLLVFQGMDAAGKDSVIKHVMSGVNPQGCSPPRKNWITITCGVRWRECRNAASSVFSIDRITRKCWWCGSTPIY
jgi:hypothetical protein